MRFLLSRSILPLVLMIFLFHSVMFSIMVTFPEVDIAGLYASRAFIFVMLHALLFVFCLVILVSAVGCGL